MSHGVHFSLARFYAVILKEFIQMRRDRLTFAIMIGIPVVQLIIFGYAINFDPKGLPTAVAATEQSVFTRDMMAAMKNSGYFKIVAVSSSEREARRLLDIGAVQFIASFPPRFARDLLRGEKPAMLLEADATDPVAAANAIGAMSVLARNALERDLPRSLFENLRPSDGAMRLIVHPRYNPEGITRYNIVPGLMGVVLTMTMVLVTGVAMTRERERGTMENLLSTPVRPVEVMLGKIVPYIMVGYVQVALILVVAKLLFNVPMIGSVWVLLLVTLLFIAANLSVGFTFSTIARNQLQAVQMAFFFFLPSIMLSGFMFPFRGMPEWAQWLGSILPLTHYLRLVRGILLKGVDLTEVTVFIWPMAAFMAVALIVAIIRYKETLD